MKICKYCGTEYDDSLDKCPNCGGNKVFSARELEEEANQQQKEIENQERAAAAPAKKKNTIIGVIAAVVVVIAAIVGFSIYKANQPLSNGMTKDEAQGIFDSGVAFMDAGQYEDAIDTFLQLPSDSKKYAEAQELLAQSQDSYRADIISRVDSQVANGDYDSAFSLVEKAQSILPGDAELQNAYDNTYSAYRATVLAKADEYSQSGQYKMALEYLAGVQTTFADDAQIRDAYDNINLAYKDEVRTTALTDADNYVASADYVSAINTLNSAISEIGQDEEITAKLNIISQEYKQILFSDAQNAYHNEGYEVAVNMLQQGRGVLGDDEELIQLIDDYSKCAPIPLDSLNCTYADAGGFQQWKVEPSIMGEEYCTYTNVQYYFNGFIDYALLGQYKRITGDLIYNGGAPWADSVGVSPEVSFYSDSNLIATYTVSNSNRSVHFDIPIDGTDYLRIEVKNMYVPDGTIIAPEYYLVGGITNLYVYKNVMP